MRAIVLINFTFSWKSCKTKVPRIWKSGPALSASGALCQNLAPSSKLEVELLSLNKSYYQGIPNNWHKKILKQIECTSGFPKGTWFTHKQNSGKVFFFCKKHSKTAGFMWHLCQNHYVLIWWMTCLKHQETAFGMGRWVRNSEKVCVSLWWGAWCGSWHTHSFSPHSSQVEEVVWGQQVCDSENIHCSLWGLDWGYPLNNCSGCWMWFKVFRYMWDHATHPSPSYWRLQTRNNCIY